MVGRYLYIGELKYDVTNIPEDFKSIKKKGKRKGEKGT